MGGYRGMDSLAYWDKDKGQSVSFSGTSAQSGEVGKDIVTVYATAACWVTWGSDPTATAAAAGNLYIPATTYVDIPGLKATDKLAVIQASATGTLYVYPRVA